uniref:Betl4 n=1 Tax=Arundo donax TaxID=35708 RepID=A0A0A9AZH3_ARUDO
MIKISLSLYRSIYPFTISNRGSCAPSEALILSYYVFRGVVYLLYIGAHILGYHHILLD